MSNQTESLKQPFIKSLFHGKYIVPLIVIQGLLSLSLLAPEVPNVGFIMLIVIFYLSKKVSTNEEKVLVSSHQWVSFFTYLLITIIVLAAVMASATSQSYTAKKDIVSAMVSNINKNVPVKVNEYLVLTKASKIDNTSLMMDAHYINYTRDEVLAGYKNEKEYKTSYLQEELKTSCNGSRAILSQGVTLYETVYGKMNQAITQIYINNERCKAYYL